jgi:hypothetical protein
MTDPRRTAAESIRTATERATRAREAAQAAMAKAAQESTQDKVEEVSPDGDQR